MIETRLKEATAVIRKGDKATGKDLLLDILHDDPENDTAWVWMSAVVDTDELRLECLEEALKYNPDNQMAQKGVAKLQKKVVGKTAVSPSSAPSVSKISSSVAATLTYLSRRLIIEKQYQLLQNPSELNPLVDSFELNEPGKLRSNPVANFPELEPLFAYFNVVLFRKGGGSFSVVCMKVRDAQMIDNTLISQDLLVEIGRNCLNQSPVITYGQKAPIGFEIWEFFERDFTPDDDVRLTALKRIPGRKKVSVTALAIDVFSHKVRKSYLPGITSLFSAAYPNRVNRWLSEEHSFSETETLRAVASGGVKLGSIALGVGIGVVLAIAIEFLLLFLQWPSGWFVDAIGAVTAVLIAIMARKVRVDNKRQGMIAGGLYGIAYYAIMLFLFGYWLGLIWIWNIAVMIGIGWFFGRVTDP